MSLDSRRDNRCECLHAALNYVLEPICDGRRRAPPPLLRRLYAFPLSLSFVLCLCQVRYVQRFGLLRLQTTRLVITRPLGDDYLLLADVFGRVDQRER